MTAFRRFALGIQRIVNGGGVLERCESLALRTTQGATAPPPILLLGAPRSGSTFAFEILVTGFEVAYVTNVASLLYTAPVLATRALRALGLRHRPRFTSDLGYVAGLAGPSEAGPLCRHWFGDRRQPPALDVDAVRRRHAGLCRLAGGPLVFKNLYLVDTLDTLTRVFPRFLVVHLVRDPVAVAASILATRERLFGTPAAWWGPSPPPDTPPAPADPIAEVVAQVARIDARVAQLADARSGAYLRVGYDAVCADPGAFLAEVAAAYRRTGGPALRVRAHAPPVPPPTPGDARIPPARRAAIEQVLARRATS